MFMSKALKDLATGCCLIGFPQYFFAAHDHDDPTAPDKKCVAETVEIAGGFFGDIRFTGNLDQQPLGAAANGPANMKIRVCVAAARKYKGAESGKVAVAGVDVCF